MILLYRNDASHFSDYFGIQVSDYDMAVNGTGLLDNLRGGDDVVELVYADNDGNLNWNNNTDVVDAVGTRGQGGIDIPWNYSLGWIKRKNGRSINKTFKLSEWTLCKGCFGASYTHAEATTPYDINNRLINLGGMGSNSNTLELTNISYDEYNGALVRAKVSNPGFVCQVDTVSCEARIQVVPIDTDGDGIPDKDDLDDDNDGILDVTEGGGGKIQMVMNT